MDFNMLVLNMQTNAIAIILFRIVLDLPQTVATWHARGILPNIVVGQIDSICTSFHQKPPPPLTPFLLAGALADASLIVFLHVP